MFPLNFGGLFKYVQAFSVIWVPVCSFAGRGGYLRLGEVSELGG